MSTLLKNFIGNGSRDRELTDAQARAVLEQIRQERGQCEVLLRNAHASINTVQQLQEPIARAGTDMEALASRLASLEQRLGGSERLVALLQTLDERAERLSQNQRNADVRVAHASDDVQRIRSQVEELSHKADMALSLKQGLDGFLELERPFQQLRGDAEELRTQMAGASEHLRQVREQQARVMDAHKLALTKMEAFDHRHEELARAVQDDSARLAMIEQAVRGLADVEQTVEDARRKLAAVKSVGDAVAQKTAELDAQRGSLERAIARVDNLDEAMRRIDTGLRQQQENASTLERLQEQITELQSLHGSVMQRSREINEFQQRSEDQARLIRAELATARDDARKSVERFDFDRSGLESVAQRVADLRTALTDFETRFSGVHASSQTLDEVNSRTQTLTAQLQAVFAEVSRVNQEAERMQAIRRDLEETVHLIEDAGERAKRIESAQPTITAALRDVEQLRGAHALVKDALEQTRLASSETVRVREQQMETQFWLAGVEQMVGELRQGVSEVQKLAPTVELVQKQAERVNDSMLLIESRRDFVENLYRRLGELGTLSANLDERGRELHSRLEGAEQRFAGLSEHAAEVDRLSKVIGAVSSSVSDVRAGADEFAKKAAAAEARCESVEGLADRVRTLREEVEQRQHALEEAAQNLQSVSQLRQEAAASAQELDERVYRLAEALAETDRQVTRVDVLSSQIDQRAARLSYAERRLAEFEDRLTRFEQVEQEIGRSLEQLAARQGTIEALQADVSRMFTIAEQTATDVRAITSAQTEMEESRRLLEDVRNRLADVRDSSALIEDRKRQVSQAEERLGRAEALLIDVRSSLELLQGQKIMVDQAVEKSGALRSLLRQGDALIHDLREERDLVMRLRTAVTTASEQNGASGVGEVVGSE